VAKPLTFMNLSGLAVARICRRFAVEPADLIVVHDEMDLPPGRMKLKLGGGVAGHNGLASILEHLGTPDFYRLRLGIGRPEHSAQAADYVLSPFAPAELALVPATIAAAVKGLLTFMRRGPQAAAQEINSFEAANPPESL
jgi:PTH1 family peptidyl-tRNA hydrolase